MEGFGGTMDTVEESQHWRGPVVAAVVVEELRVGEDWAPWLAD